MPRAKGVVPDPEHLLTLKQAAERLGISTRTLRRWRAAQRIRTYRVAGRIKILQLDIDAALTPQEEQ